MVLSIFSFLASIAVITGPAIALALIASVCDFDEQDCALYDMAVSAHAHTHSHTHIVYRLPLRLHRVVSTSEYRLVF